MKVKLTISKNKQTLYMKKRVLQLTVATLITAMASNKTSAQKTEPIFEISAGNAIANTKFLHQASTGELISGNDLKLFAVDPDKKIVIWENNDFLGLDEDDVTVIEGTPFIKIERQKKLSLSKNKNTYIIQARDGKVVYDSKDEGIKVRSTLIVPKLNGLLIESVKDGFLSVSLIDFATAKELWTVPLAKEKTGGIGIGALKRAVKSHSASAFNVAPITDNNQNLVLVNKKEVFCINKNGQLAWKKEYDENVDDAYLGNDGATVFIGYKKYIDKLKTASGSSALGEPIKMRDALNGIVPMGDRYIVCNEAGINIMDANGAMLWKKDTKLGNIIQAKYTDNGILAIESIDGKDEETAFYWIDNEGKKVWDQKVAGTLILAEPTDKGVMYVTTERANVLTYEKGKDVWNKDIKLKGTPNFGTDIKNKILYAYAKGKVHTFNFSDNTYKLLAEDLELKKFDDEKEPAGIDVRNGKVVVYTNQNVAALQTGDGKVLYNNYFKDIGNSKKKLMKFAGTALSAYGATRQIGGLGNMAAGTPNGIFGNTSQLEKGAGQYESGASLNQTGNALYDEASKRYLASQATKDNLYILSEMPEGNGMLVWNKDKGEITKKITFSDATPQYVVDEATDRVYIVVGSVIKAYDLK